MRAFQDRRLVAITVILLAMIATGCTVTERAAPTTDQVAVERQAELGDGSGTGNSDDPEGPLGFAVDSFVGQVWTVYNTDEGLNLRTGPGIEFQSIVRLPAGTEVTTSGSVADVNGQTWFEVSTDRDTGWVHSAYLTIDTIGAATTIPTLAFADDSAPSTGDPAAFAAGARVTPNEGLVGVNIRAVPNGTGEIVLGMRAGDVGTITGTVDGDWVEVQFRGVTGWSLAELITETNQPATGSQTVRTIDIPGGTAAIHRDPENDSEVIAIASHGAEVTATGVETASGWTELILDAGTLGWIPNELLAPL